MKNDKPAAAGGVDVRSEACPTCGQVNVGQTGEHPCTACGLPTLHDPDSADELPSLEEARRELRAEGIDPDELGRRMRERVESMLRAIHPPSSATSSSTSEVPPTLDPGRPLQWGDRVVIRPYEEWPCDLGQHARARNSWVSKCRELAGHEGVINSEGESEGCVMVYLRREPYGTVRDIPATIVRRVSP